MRAADDRAKLLRDAFEVVAQHDAHLEVHALGLELGPMAGKTIRTHLGFTHCSGLGTALRACHESH